jgi:hypothetical protein
MSARPSPPDFGAAFDRTLRLSQFARRVIAARPEVEADVRRWHGTPIARAEMRSALAEGPELARACGGCASASWWPSRTAT